MNQLRELEFTNPLHDKMPDIVLCLEEKDWLYFIESVTSVRPMIQNATKRSKK